MDRFQSAVLLILRLAGGLYLALGYGWPRLAGSAGSGEWMAEVMGTVGQGRPALLLSAALVSVELVGGLLATFGVLTRSVSGVLILYLAGTYPVGIGAEDLAIRLACGGGFFLLLLTGPGRYSLDEYLKPPNSPEYVVVNRSQSSANDTDSSEEDGAK